MCKMNIRPAILLALHVADEEGDDGLVSHLAQGPQSDPLLSGAANIFVIVNIFLQL